MLNVKEFISKVYSKRIYKHNVMLKKIVLELKCYNIINYVVLVCP